MEDEDAEEEKEERNNASEGGRTSGNVYTKIKEVGRKKKRRIRALRQNRKEVK